MPLDFPSGPSNGQVYSYGDQSWIYDSANTMWNGLRSPSGKQTWFIPASSMQPKTVNGAGLLTYDSGASNTAIKLLRFDTATQQFADYQSAMPKSWNLGTITYKAYWTTANGQSTNTMSWLLQARAMSDNDVIDGGYGTAIEITDTFQSNGNVHITDESADMTVANTPLIYDYVGWRISRNVANDNLYGDAYLLGVQMYVTCNVQSDD